MTTLRTWQAVGAAAAVAVVFVLTGCGSADDTPAQNASAPAEASDNPASATPGDSAAPTRSGDQPTAGATMRPHADVCPTAYIGFALDKGVWQIRSTGEQLAFGGFDIIQEPARPGKAIRLVTELSNEAIYVLGIAVTNAQGKLTLKPYDAQVAVEEPTGTKEVVFLLHNRQYPISLDFPKKYRQLYRNC